MKIKVSFLVLLGIIFGSIFLFTNNVNSTNSDIVINEVCPTGCADVDNQWVEIFNQGLEPVNIFGWKFWEGDTNHALNLVEGTTSTLEAGEYAVIVQKNYPSSSVSSKIFDSSWGTLNKSGEIIGLKYDVNNFADGPFTYLGVANFSLERKQASVSSSVTDNWVENPSGNTVGVVNYWTNYVPPPPPAPVNQNPSAIINAPTSTTVGTTTEFKGSDSSDPDGTIASYEWFIGGEAVGSSSSLSYQFATSGSFGVSLQVTDNQGVSASTSVEILVNSQTPNSDNQTSIVTLYLNEFLPDPSASTEPEWVEIYNPSTSTVDLSGWTLSDSIGVRSSPTGTIMASGFFVIELTNVLNNTGDTIILKNSNGEISDQIIYGTSALPAPAKGNSLARTIDGAGNFIETTVLTKGQGNIISAPIVVVHQSVSSGASVTQNNVIQNVSQNSTGQIIINELLPNPKGSDTENEFIELKNIGASSVNLQDWVLADVTSKYKIKEGNIFAGGFVVFKRSLTNISLNNSGGEEVKLSNPAGSVVDAVKYSGSAGEDESYSRDKNNVWNWTTKLTPGAENIFVNKNLPPVVAVAYDAEPSVGETAVFDASDSFDPEGNSLNFVWLIGEEKINGEILKYVFDRAGERVITLDVDDGKGNKVEKKIKVNVVRDEDSVENKTETKIEIKNSVKTGVVTKKSVGGNQVVISITLDKIRDREIGDRVKVVGVVAVEPGVLGSQYFYIVDPQTSTGVQVYSNKKDFPVLKIGDKIEVSGELSEISGERRVKTKTKNEIKKIGGEVVLNPKIVEVSEVGEDVEGNLVQVQGEVTEVKATYMYVDDGNGEIKVYFKKGTAIDSKNFIIGDLVKVTGLVGQTKTEYVLLPRAENDIEKTGLASDALILQNKNTTSDKSVAETYLTATAGGLTSILIGLFAKARGKLALGLVKKTGVLALNLIKRNPRV